MSFLKNIESLTKIIINAIKIKNELKKDNDKDKIELETEKIINDEIENKNNTRLSDAIRKEKQEKINSMKNIIILVILCLFSGCQLFKDPVKQEIQNHYDINSLKSSEKTYRISEPQVISIYDGDNITNYNFTIDWFVVHSDFLKTFNENQNLILNNNKKTEDYIKSLKNSGIVLVIITVSLLIINFILIYKLKIK